MVRITGSSLDLKPRLDQIQWVHDGHLHKTWWKNVSLINWNRCFFRMFSHFYNHLLEVSVTSFRYGARNAWTCFFNTTQLQIQKLFQWATQYQNETNTITRNKANKIILPFKLLLKPASKKYTTITLKNIYKQKSGKCIFLKKMY